MSNKSIILDANILIRAVLGRKVFKLLLNYKNSIDFFATDDSFADAQKYLPIIFDARGLDRHIGNSVLNQLPELVQVIDLFVYCEFESEAKKRIRDSRDWDVLAAAMALNCPIWTEDNDFFGTGIATWTTRTIPIYLSENSDESLVKN